MKKLIRQIRSLGSLLKGYGVHVLHNCAGKPKVFFKAPTYLIGGSNSSFTRQGGFISIKKLFMAPRLIIRQVRYLFGMFTLEIMFLREIKIKRFDYRPGFPGYMINLDREVYLWDKSLRTV